MSSSKFSLTKVLVECPELVEECFKFISSVVPEDTKVSITSKLANTYTALQPKWKDFFCFSPEEIDSMRSKMKAYQMKAGSNPLAESSGVDYGDQLEATLPFVDYIYDLTVQNKLFWNEETCSHYHSSLSADEECHEYRLSLKDNGSALLDGIVFKNGSEDDSFSIGQDGFPVHPLLDKKLSDLFLFVEGIVPREGCPEPDQEEDVENQTTIEDRRISSFVLQLIALTEKKSIAWKTKEGSSKRFRVLIKKRNDIQILVELMRGDDGSVEVRAAQVIDRKLRKVFHIAADDYFENSELEDNVKRLYALVECGCL